MACRYFLGDKELKGDTLTSYMKSLPHEEKLKVAPEIAKDSYQRLSWTPGEAQAARYDLSKQIDKIQYHSEQQRLLAFDKNHSLKMDQIVAPNKISDFVGKDTAKKLLDAKSDHLGIHSLENADLKIGGEGMKGFYDKMIPSALEKIGKEHGVKVKQGEIESPYYGNGQSSIKIKIPTKHTIHYIDIPKSLKDTAMHRGFPLFSAGIPLPLMPIDHNPWKFKPVEGDPFEDKKK